MLRTKEENLALVIKYLPSAFSAVLSCRTDELCEIRIRADRPAVLVFRGKTGFLTEGGRLTFFKSENLLCVSARELEEIFIRLCSYSVHSLTESINSGFITLDGGIRVGVYGTATVKDSRIVSVRNISGLNIRIPAEIRGCADKLYNEIFSDKIRNTVICGPPMSGKTTVLRDLCRLLSDVRGKKIAVIDERLEMSGYDLGINTDILKGYPKSEGTEIAVRTLSPDIIICDEIGSTEEAARLCDAFNGGVGYIATIHCGDMRELRRKPQFALLKSSLDCCVFFSRESFEIQSVVRIDDEDSFTDCNEPCLRDGGAIYRLQAQ